MYSDSYSWEMDEVNNQMCHYHVRIADGVPYQKSVFVYKKPLARPVVPLSFQRSDNDLVAS